MVIQPNDKISVEEVTKSLCTEKVFNELGFCRHARSNALQIIIKREKIEIPVDITIVDHYVYPNYRKYYNLKLTENKISSFPLGNSIVPVLNAPWILRQLIGEWNECSNDEKKVEIIPKIKTMSDVLSLEKKKLHMTSKRDINELRNLRDHFEDDPSILRAVIDCPEVLGPWYNLRWVRNLLLVITIIAASLACDYYASEDIDDLVALQHVPYKPGTPTRSRIRPSAVMPIFCSIEDVELQVSLDAGSTLQGIPTHVEFEDQGYAGV